jgi:hypothetical protein
LHNRLWHGFLLKWGKRELSDSGTASNTTDSERAVPRFTNRLLEGEQGRPEPFARPGMPGTKDKNFRKARHAGDKGQENVSVGKRHQGKGVPPRAPVR